MNDLDNLRFVLSLAKLRHDVFMLVKNTPMYILNFVICGSWSANDHESLEILLPLETQLINLCLLKKDQNEGGKIKLDKFRNNTLLEM